MICLFLSNLAKCFVTRELMRWPGIEGLYGALLRETDVFGKGKPGEKRWEDLHMRVIEHVRALLALSDGINVGFIDSFFRTSV
jgi:hypothetical protein